MTYEKELIDKKECSNCKEQTLTIKTDIDEWTVICRKCRRKI